MRPPQPALFTTGHESPASSWHVLSPGWRAVCTQTSRPMADARMVRPVAEFDLSSAVGVGGLTAAAGIAIRSASCQQPRVAALVGAAAAIGLCAVARRRHRPSDLRVFCSHAPHSPRADCAPHQQDTCSCKQCENLVAPLSGGAARKRQRGKQSRWRRRGMPRSCNRSTGGGSASNEQGETGGG